MTWWKNVDAGAWLWLALIGLPVALGIASWFLEQRTVQLIGTVLMGAFLVTWFGSIAYAIVDQFFLHPIRGYEVRGGRATRWIAWWYCKDCGTLNHCPRRGTGLRCKNKACRSERVDSVEFWYAQSRLPRRQRIYQPGTPVPRGLTAKQLQ